MVDHQDTFALFAELSLALAGFAGVAASFGGHDRSYGPDDQNRLLALFVSAGTTLAGSVTILTLGATGIQMRTVFLTASALLFPLAGITLFRRAPINYRLARDPGTAIRPWAAHLSSVYLVVVSLLYGTNFILGGEAWPLLAGFSLQLVFGLWIFFRLLTQPR